MLRRKLCVVGIALAVAACASAPTSNTGPAPSDSSSALKSNAPRSASPWTAVPLSTPGAPPAPPTAPISNTSNTAALAAAFGEDLAPLWDVQGGADALKTVDDPILRSPVAHTEKTATVAGRFTIAPGSEITYRARVATTEQVKSAYANFSLGAEPFKMDKDRTLEIHGALNGAAGRFTFNPYPTVSPVLDPAIRLPIERDMAAGEQGQDHWFLCRVQIGAGWIRAWLDDRLVWEKRGIEVANLRPTFMLTPNARIADFRVRAMPVPSAMFETVPLDGYVNESRLGSSDKSVLASGALPFGQTVAIDGVPLRFVDRAARGGLDHIDISPSLCRQGNWEGYHAANGPRFGGTAFRDPARIQLAIPNASYRNLYVVAAFDETPGRVPILSAMFYRKGASFPMVFEATIPSLRAGQAEATPLPVSLQNGDKAKLWLVKIPLDPAMLASFADLDILEVELTKQVFQHRSYPDPYMYGWHQGGLPSGVRVYAMTLERPAVDVVLEPSQFGHVWQAGTTPRYSVKLASASAATRTLTVSVSTESHDQTEKPAAQVRPINLAPLQKTVVTFDLPVKRNGIHRVTATLTDGKETWTERRNLCLLAKDTRAEKWTPGQGSLFGYWSYHGGHYTPPADDNVRLMAWAGARSTIHKPALSEATMRDYWDKHGFTQGPNAWPVHGQWDLAGDNVPPEKVAAFQRQVIENITKAQGENPEFVTFFPEPHISLETTVANPRDYWGEKPYEMNEQEKTAFKMFWNTSKFAAEAVRAKWPNTKILIPWGDPGFFVPFLRAGFPKNLVDGCGLDMIGFERMPEQQLKQASTHRLYILKNEFKKAGIENPMLPYVEGVFAPTEPGALTWEEQAERLHRWNLISMAYGIDRYYSSWTSFDGGSYYGTEHYAGCGIFRRIPYADPKPAYAHYATMTRMLDRAKFTRWLPTGSLTTYCLEFETPDRGLLYAFWNIRGKRPVTLSLEADKPVTVNDAMDNATQVASKDKKAVVTISTTPVYVYGAGKLQAVTVGEPDHSDTIAWARGRNQDTWSTGVLARRAEPEIRHEIKLASLGDGAWKNSDETDEVYQTNNYDSHRYPGKMSTRAVADEGHGAALAVKLEKQPVERQLMPFFTVIKPAKQVTIPGKASGIGLWVKANSDWGRVVYCLRDAKGERWLSVGHKDEWNCDDVHSWSAFNYDGWRYLRFELPGHLPYDNFREYGTTWWRFAGGDGIVDLPLSVEKIIVERRTHVLYVNDVQPTDAENRDVLLGDLVAEYTSKESATDAAVKLSKVRMPLPEVNATMMNPIAAAASNPLPATTLKGVKDPDWGADGTRCHVNFDAAAGAKEYQVYVAAHPDGRGAQPMARMKASGELLQGLRPQTTFYLWVIHTDADKKASKPSNRVEIKLVDTFGMK